jgi:outer membrane protein TolC
MCSRSVSVLVAVLSIAVCGSSRAQEAVPLLLPDLIREALERNPEVQVAARRVEAKRARAGQAGALPDPMLMYGIINEGRPIPLQTVGERDFSELYVGVSQDLPYPGKRALRTKAANEDAAAEDAAYRGVRRRVAAEVAEAYYDLYAVHAGLDAVEQNRQLLEQVAKAAGTRSSVGQGTQQDVLDAEVEVSRVEERRSQLEGRRAVLEARLASLMLRNDGRSWARPSPIAVTPLRESLDQLLAQAEEQSPLLRAAERLIAGGERKLDLARRERLPDFGVNFTYHNRGGLDPFYTFGGTLTLPNVHGRPKRLLEEADADLAGARSSLDAARAEVRYAVTEAYRKATTAERLLRLYQEGILKQARLSLDSAMAQYGAGRLEFPTLIASWRRLLDADLMYHEQLAEHEKALARLALHVGERS